MIEPKIYPQIGEIWKLVPMPDNDYDWSNVLILEKNNAQIFVSAKIVNTSLPIGYIGSNIEISYSSPSGISAPFVIYIDEPREFDIRYFQQKCGKLNDADLEKVSNYYLDYKNKMEVLHGKKN